MKMQYRLAIKNKGLKYCETTKKNPPPPSLNVSLFFNICISIDFPFKHL